MTYFEHALQALDSGWLSVKKHISERLAAARTPPDQTEMLAGANVTPEDSGLPPMLVIVAVGHKNVEKLEALLPATRETEQCFEVTTMKPRVN